MALVHVVMAEIGTCKKYPVHVFDTSKGANDFVDSLNDHLFYERWSSVTELDPYIESMVPDIRDCIINYTISVCGETRKTK